MSSGKGLNKVWKWYDTNDNEVPICKTKRWHNEILQENLMDRDLATEQLQGYRDFLALFSKSSTSNGVSQSANLKLQFEVRMETDALHLIKHNYVEQELRTHPSR